MLPGALHSALPKNRFIADHRFNLLSSLWSEMNKDDGDAEHLLGTQEDEVKVRWVVMRGERRGGEGVKRGMRESLCLFGVGGLCLVEVAGAAIGVVV